VGPARFAIANRAIRIVSSRNRRGTPLRLPSRDECRGHAPGRPVRSFGALIRTLRSTGRSGANGRNLYAIRKGALPDRERAEDKLQIGISRAAAAARRPPARAWIIAHAGGRQRRTSLSRLPDVGLGAGAVRLKSLDIFASRSANSHSRLPAQLKPRHMAGLDRCGPRSTVSVRGRRTAVAFRFYLAGAIVVAAMRRLSVPCRPAWPLEPILAGRDAVTYRKSFRALSTRRT
jgi:hypothetical protein